MTASGGAPAATARFWTASGDTVTCTLCPHRCKLSPGSTGLCGVRTNTGGTLALPYYGRTSAVAVDPIEKKPLYHFHPGKQILSVGFVGCNLRCPFCQNADISQSTTRAARSIAPADLVAQAADSGSFAIAYTYNEPAIHFEYVTAVAATAQDRGILNVLVTNGHLNPEPAAEILDLMDAVNVDLKSFQPDFYRTELGGDLATAKEFIALAVERCHVEVTTLLIPGANSDDAEVDAMAGFVASFSPDIPYHISAYYPAFHYDRPATTPEQVEHAMSIASSHLNYVYAGNTRAIAETRCPACGNLLVTRRGYNVSSPGLRSGTCAKCGAAAPVITA